MPDGETPLNFQLRSLRERACNVRRSIQKSLGNYDSVLRVSYWPAEENLFSDCSTISTSDLWVCFEALADLDRATGLLDFFCALRLLRATTPQFGRR